MFSNKELLSGDVEIWQKFDHKIFHMTKIVSYRKGVFNRNIVEDIFSQARERFWIKLIKNEVEEGKSLALFKKIVESKLSNNRRKIKFGSIDGMEQLRSGFFDTNKIDLYKSILECISQFNEKTAKVFYYKFLEDMDYKIIGEKLV
ncbi:MAG: hypothetical protein IPN86_20885 [Saprospiraceae bacterium]|nr:hypothetical protein [Saprospiraceae bacterium]